MEIVIAVAVLAGVVVGAAITLWAVKLGIRVGAQGVDAVQPRKQLPKPYVPTSDLAR